MAFNRSNMLKERYTLVERPGADSPSDKGEESDRDAQEYARFLKEKERKCGPEGFVDSSRYQNSYSVKQAKRSQPKDKQRPFSVVELRCKKERDVKDFDRTLKSIEDHMWQHKQEERELKRFEGDIVKNQRSLRRSLRDLENAISRKKMAEEKKQGQSIEKSSRLQQQNLRQREELMKQRSEQNQQGEQSQKDAGRKLQLTTSNLTRQYRTKIGELEMKKAEINRISESYEVKLRQKEDEQIRLKQELANLAITLNMEAQKGRQKEYDYQKEKKNDSKQRQQAEQESEGKLNAKISKSENDIKTAESEKRRLSAEVTLSRSHIQLKQREESRHKLDTQNRLRDNLSGQKELNMAAEETELDLKSRQLDQKVQGHEFRRRQRMEKSQRERKDRSEQHENTYYQKFQIRYIDQQRREHEDHLRHFQKAVSKGEEAEYNLYNRVKNTEYSRQKQAQTVRQLQKKISAVKRENAEKIKTEMIEISLMERELEQNLLKEQAELDKVHARREEAYNALQHHRENLREEKYLLTAHEREQDRLKRIGTRTDALAQSYA